MSDAEMYKGRERRSAERVKVNFRARWKGSWATREGEIADLSTDGCFILTDDLVSPGEGVMIEVRLPVEGSITVLGQVVYQVEEVGFAVRFSQFTQEDERRKLGWLVRAEATRAKQKESSPDESDQTPAEGMERQK